MKMRLNKFISSNTSYSRRKADELIQAGKIFINNKPAKIGTQIDPKKDKITIRGSEAETINENLITHQTKKIYLALNKPANFITTRSDDLNRKTVMSLVPKIENLKPVGRLDKNTEGLILFSNDGEFINKHTHPRFECEKEYFVKIKGMLSDKEKSALEKGIMLEGKKTSPAKIKIIKESLKQTTLTVTIHEGRNRQIRKMFAQLKHDVKYLQRIRIDKISLGSLKKGEYRELTLNEINAN